MSKKADRMEYYRKNHLKELKGLAIKVFDYYGEERLRKQVFIPFLTSLLEFNRHIISSKETIEILCQDGFLSKKISAQVRRAGQYCDLQINRDQERRISTQNS